MNENENENEKATVVSQKIGRKSPDSNLTLKKMGLAMMQEFLV